MGEGRSIATRDQSRPRDRQRGRTRAQGRGNGHPQGALSRGSGVCNEYLRQSAEAGKILRKQISEIVRAANWIRDARRVWICGNGGSALTASHFAVDLTKTAWNGSSRRIDARSLCDSIGMLSAVGNDRSFSATFSDVLTGQVQKGDVLVAISCSGNSQNVVNAAMTAQRAGAKVIALDAFASKNIVEHFADLTIRVPIDSYGVGEDSHMIVCHLITELIRKADPACASV